MSFFKFNTIEMKAIHVGQMIEQEMLRQEKSTHWLANEINRERSSVYKIYHRESVDVTMLIRISVILNHDFFKDLSRQVFER